MRPEFPLPLVPRALFALALASPCVAAQVPAGVEPLPDPEPDVSLTATVRARSVEFHSPPRVDVVLTGTPGRRDVDRTWRDRLPDEVLPGRTYRDIGIRLEASTTLDPATIDLGIESLQSNDPPIDETTP